MHARRWEVPCLCPLRRSRRQQGSPRLAVTLPDWLLKDEQGQPVSTVELAAVDALAMFAGVAACSAELASGHTNFTLNNLIACVIATDILQVGFH